MNLIHDLFKATQPEHSEALTRLCAAGDHCLFKKEIHLWFGTPAWVKKP